MKSGDTKSISTYSEIYGRLFRDNYFVMKYNFVQFFVEHLADVSRIFEADLQAVLVLAVVGQMELQARIRANFREEGEMPVEFLIGAQPRINATSIAEVTGIPRETVRRKLHILQRRGWITRDGGGLWHMVAIGADVPPARRDLWDLNHRGTERISRFLGLMHALAVDAKSGNEKSPTPRD